MNQDILIELMLLATQGVGTITINKIKDFASKQRVSLTELWKRLGTTAHSKLPKSGVIVTEIQQAHIQELQRRFSPFGYGEYLQNKGITVVQTTNIIDSALVKEWALPSLLLAKGDPARVYTQEAKNKQVEVPKVAVVGTRVMTPYGAYATQTLVQELVNQFKATIVSGCMVGVDTVAHQTALQNTGLSLGVVGFGFDHWYPQKYQAMYTEWLDHGLVQLSEYPPWIAPTKGTFVQRNRLIAALSDTTVVVEAPRKSGALITAQFASEYGKSVGAIPGLICSPQSEGTHKLLKEGAYLVSSAQDVVNELPTYRNLSSLNRAEVLPTMNQSIGYEQWQLVQKLMVKPESFDTLLVQTQFSIAILRKLLTELELAGIIWQVAGRWQLTAEGHTYLHRPVQ